LFELMVEASAEPGFMVCDPFCGSGSSGVAALLGGCDFIGADIDARAVDIAEERLARFTVTGQDPLEPVR
jgi:DNA modification methylase